MKEILEKSGNFVRGKSGNPALENVVLAVWKPNFMSFGKHTQQSKTDA